MYIHRFLALLTIVVFGVGANISLAKMVQKNEKTSEANTFSSVSSADLINQGQSTLKSHVRSPVGSFGDNTNDGAAKLGSAKDGEYWPSSSQPNTLTYTLNTSEHTQGYDITKVVLVTGWAAAEESQANLDFEMLVSKVGSGEFTSLGFFKYTPYYDTKGGAYAVRMTLTDDAGTIASGVDEVRFIFKAASHEGTHPGLVIREIDVEGAAAE